MTMMMTTKNNTAAVNNSSRPAVLKPIYEEKAQLQQEEDGNDTETTCDETESCYEEEEEGCDQQQQYPPAEEEEEEEEGDYYMYDGDEYTYEEYTVVDDEYEHGGGNGNGTTCGDEYTYVTVQDESPQREINVRFHPSLTIHLIPTRSEFSSKERKRYWTSSEEKQKTQRRLSKTVNRMIAREQAQAESASSPSASRKHHHSSPRSNQNTVERRYRGLENFSIKGDYNCGELIRTMINSVMDEQDRQWLTNVTDEIRIAEISQSISYDNILKAQLIAKHDEEDAINVYSRDPETFFDGYYKQANATATATDDKVDCETSSSKSLCHKIQKKVTIRRKKQLQRNQRKSSRRLVVPDP